MVPRLAAAALALLPAIAMAQQPGAPVPLSPGSGSPSITAEPLPPPPASGPGLTAPPVPSAPAAPQGAALSPEPAGPAVERVFCQQPISVRLPDRDAAPDRYRPFVGIWSDASWSPQLCAALVVTSVAPDGTASIVYVFGPMGPNARSPGGILRGTGIVQDGELKFQNSDGSQFAFRPLYADLDGRLTTPQGQNYQAVFKKTP